MTLELKKQSEDTREVRDNGEMVGPLGVVGCWTVSQDTRGETDKRSTGEMQRW